MLKALKFGTVIVCGVCFILNSLDIFYKFFKGSKLVLQTTKANPELPLPVMVFCGKSAFKEIDLEGIMGWSKERYMQQTADPTDGIKSLQVHSFEWATGQRTRIDAVKIGHLNTMFAGRCLTVEIQRKVCNNNVPLTYYFIRVLSKLTSISIAFI